MPPLSKLTLTSYRRTQPNRDPIEERRSKTLAALTQQKLVLEAALKGLADFSIMSIRRRISSRSSMSLSLIQKLG